jgi:hypothetical protein
MTFASSRLSIIALAALTLISAACASSSSSMTTISQGVTAARPDPDPRVGLKPGWFDAGEAIWNLAIVSKTPPSDPFVNRSTPGDERLKNSDLAFLGNYVFQGNYSGWQVWDISDPRKPMLKKAYVCRTCSSCRPRRRAAVSTAGCKVCRTP